MRKLSYKLSLVNSHQLSCNFCSHSTRTQELKNSHTNSRFSVPINSHRPRPIAAYAEASHNYLLFHGMVKVVFLPVSVDNVITKSSSPWLTVINTYERYAKKFLFCKTWKSAGTSCQIEIHFSIQIIKFVAKYKLLCF